MIYLLESWTQTRAPNISVSKNNLDVATWHVAVKNFWRFNFFVYEIALNLLFFRKYFWKHLVEVKDHEVFFFSCRIFCLAAHLAWHFRG